MHLINIIGWSGSGKWLLAERIIKDFWPDKVDTVPYDMYYYPDEVFPKSLYVEFEWHHYKNFDTPEALETDLLVKHLEMLKNGQEVQIPEYDFGNNPTKKSQRKPGRIVHPKDFIILDGLFGLCDERLRKLTDVSIFIELSATNRFARRIIRDWGSGRVRWDMGEPGMRDDIIFYVQYVQDGYAKYVEAYKQYANLIVDNNEWVPDGKEPKMVDIVINYLKGRFSEGTVK